MSLRSPQSYSFTLKSDAGKFREIVSKIGISVPVMESGGIRGDDKRIHYARALWDTGATDSVVTKSTAKALNLKPTAMTQCFHAGGESRVNSYLVYIYLPNNIFVPNIRVSERDEM
ncbi:MAG: hypothetical protein OXH57_06775, partial [Ekhidna sp.]|nr:hypothetical protein [Ekhidna sp.]